MGKVVIRDWQFTGLTEELAYVVGVYLGDGWIQGNSLALSVIDRDFVEYFRNCVMKLGSQFQDIPPIYERHRVQFNKLRINFDFKFGCAELCRWLKEITELKTRVPRVIMDSDPSIIKAFLLGIMDSEGYISKSAKPAFQNGNYRFLLGVAMSEAGIMQQVKKLYEKLDIMVGNLLVKHENYRNPDYKDMFSFTINIRSYISKGMFFTSTRKSDRLRLYLKTKHPNDTIPSTTLHYPAQVAEDKV